MKFTMVVHQNIKTQRVEKWKLTANSSHTTLRIVGNTKVYKTKLIGASNYTRLKLVIGLHLATLLTYLSYIP